MVLGGELEGCLKLCLHFSVSGSFFLPLLISSEGGGLKRVTLGSSNGSGDPACSCSCCPLPHAPIGVTESSILSSFSLYFRHLDPIEQDEQPFFILPTPALKLSFSRVNTKGSRGAKVNSALLSHLRVLAENEKQVFIDYFVPFALSP